MATPVHLTLLPPAGDPVENLTPREREVLKLIASGRSNRAICAELCVASKTLERHVANVYDKLDLGHDDTRTHRRVTASLMWLRSSARPGDGAPRKAPVRGASAAPEDGGRGAVAL
jgi:DNA-binding NarL/FixJ family response regulator